MTGKNGKGRNEWVESFWNEIFFFSKERNDKNKLKYQKLQKCHITYTHCIHSLSIIYKKNYILQHIPALPFAGFTNVTSKFYLVYQFTGKFKTG